MAGKAGLKGEIVLDYILKYPQLSLRALSNLIYADHEDEFTNPEDARSRIRYYLGASGNSHRNELSGKHKQLTRWREQFFSHPPVSLAESRKNYVLPKVNNNILGLFDIHCPYHDETAIEAAVRWGKEHKVNTVLFGGDQCDFYQISEFLRDPNKVDIYAELEMFYDLVIWIKHILPKADIYFLLGNHDDRIQRYLFTKAPQFRNDPELDIDHFAKLSELGVRYIKRKSIIEVGNFYLGHGDDFGKMISSPVSPARTFGMKAKANYIGGHCHRTSEWTGRGLAGEITCYSVGLLGTISPDWNPNNEWNQGFIHIRVAEDKSTKIFNARIRSGKVE